MPELPETETIARDLHEMVAGAFIADATVLRSDVLRSVTADEFVHRLRGESIVQVWRRAKLIIIDLTSADAIVVQPRFTGALLVETVPEDISPRDREYLTLGVAFADGRRMHYRDIRRLGTVALLRRAELRAYLGDLGPEPLDPELTAERFSASLRSSQAIKKVLMDQQVVAGVGNIYANEALWMAGIDPSRPAASLTDDEGAALLDSIRGVLTASIAVRGTSFRDYVDARGGRGGFVPYLQAYGRGGQPCGRCGTPLVDTSAIDGRTTVFCWRCQR